MDPFHWLFRTNIPRRRGSFLPSDIHKRNFFGMGEIIGVLVNPAHTLRSLTESRRLLDEARKEITETRERAQLRTKHTFYPLPTFFPRAAETRAIERALEGEPSFTVLFGASSVGKTALLREVLSRDAYHVLHFDLRIAGFADLASLYMSLSQQMEQYWEDAASTMPGYEDFKKESWIFKHDRIDVERRLEITDPPAGAGRVRASDISRLMELFQSSLFKYWEFQPFDPEREYQDFHNRRRPRHEVDAASDSDKTRVEPGKPKSTWGFQGFAKRREQKHQREEAEKARACDKEKVKVKALKKMPVFFIDEAHKLPALIHSPETMKCLLDSMLVLTKQDRLCHVIHATSDPFYQTWLRHLNVMQHSKVITIGDCTKAETRAYFNERMLPRVPEPLRQALNFESLYAAFGGKLAHWYDFITDYVNADGNFEIKQSSHFLQAHALLNLHIIHSSQSGRQEGESGEPRQDTSSSTQAIHPGLGPAGFKIYSAVPSPYSPADAFNEGLNTDRATAMIAGYYAADFTAMQLLKVMSRLAQPEVKYLPYFLLCREMGVRAVDGMVKGRVLDLRWSEPVTREGPEGQRVRLRAQAAPPEPGSRGTIVEAAASEDGDIVPVSEADVALGQGEDEDADEIVGPRLVAATPIMRFAMREVVQEYEDVDSPSEYASLSDVDEY